MAITTDPYLEVTLCDTTLEEAGNMIGATFMLPVPTGLSDSMLVMPNESGMEWAWNLLGTVAITLYQTPFELPVSLSKEKIVKMRWINPPFDPEPRGGLYRLVETKCIAYQEFLRLAESGSPDLVHPSWVLIGGQSLPELVELHRRMQSGEISPIFSEDELGYPTVFDQADSEKSVSIKSVSQDGPNGTTVGFTFDQLLSAWGYQ